VLRYHAICGPDGYRYASPGICISPEAFERHVAYLRASYDVVSLPAAIRMLREGAALPPNAVAVTFDDGYADNLQAARTLHRYGLTGTFYITAGCLKGELPFWPSELRALVAEVRTPLLEIAVNGESLRLPCRSAAERETTIRQLSCVFKSHPIPVRESLREQLRAIVGRREFESPMLTWDEVRQMHALGMTIGAHTVTHPNLPSAGLAAATDEIVGSKRRLEAEIGSPVTMFSYPNGGAERYYTADLQRVVREAGFEAATTSRAGFVGPASDLYSLARVEVAERLEDLVFTIEAERFISAADGELCS
jgi:peptidoglycan/xylan/chitin deacetylase (PgdA/CDA1 family)